jgi:hypothetical protein
MRQPALCRARFTLGVVLALVSPALASAQKVRGRVLDARTKVAVAGATVRLLGSADSVLASVVADDSGRFVLQAPVGGEYRVQIERLGYALSTVGPVRVAGVSETEVTLRLAPDAIPLDALTVEAESVVPALKHVGYYDRKRLGLGRFIERAYIETRHPYRLTELLMGITGVRLTRTARDGADVLLRAGATSSIANRGAMTQCRPPIYMNGVIVAQQQGADLPGRIRIDLDAILPADIEALEIYAGAAEVPPQYGGPFSGCGVILIWTRH